MIISNFLCTTVQIAYEKSTGTAFTVENISKTKQFLVTARHIFKDIQHNSTIDVKIKTINGWMRVNTVIHYPSDHDVDIAVMELVSTVYVRKTYPKELSSAGIILGQDMFFLGFPFGLCMNVSHHINDGFPLPLVKKCCLSMFESKTGKSGDGIMILDGINNPGFSGGPVCFIDHDTKKPKIGGVISAYKVNESKVFFTIEQADSAYVKENTGLIIAHDIWWAREIIDSL